MTKEDLNKLNELDREISELEVLIGADKKDKICEVIIFEFENQKQEVVATNPFIIKEVRKFINKITQEKLNTLKNDFKNF